MPEWLLIAIGICGVSGWALGMYARCRIYAIYWGVWLLVLSGAVLIKLTMA